MTVEKRTGRWTFRVTSNADAVVSEAATLAGVSKTEFVVASALDRAEALIAERKRIRLSEDEFTRFARSLDEAPTAITALVDLFDGPSQIPTS
ncbi:MAG: DUF1778 domain-containing protein [Acidimicrobiia bacterium]